MRSPLAGNLNRSLQRAAAGGEMPHNGREKLLELSVTGVRCQGRWRNRNVDVHEGAVNNRVASPGICGLIHATLQHRKIIIAARRHGTVKLRVGGIAGTHAIRWNAGERGRARRQQRADIFAGLFHDGCGWARAATRRRATRNPRRAAEPETRAPGVARPSHSTRGSTACCSATRCSTCGL